MNNQTSNPQLENGYTRIANELYEQIMKQPFNGYECRVLHAIIRKTYGYGKKNDYIAFSQISQLTGIAKTHISRTMTALIQYKVVTKLGNFTGINKDTSEWAVTKLGNSKKALNVLPKLVSELPKLVMPVTKLGIKKLPKSALQKKKETITKETYTKEISKDVSLLIDLFKNVNPSYKRFFANKTERSCAQRLIEQYGMVKLTNLMSQLPNIIRKPYAPSITSPFELEVKMGKLIAFMQQEKGKVNKFEVDEI